MDYFIIRLDTLRFYSRIGVFDQERTVGNEFVVDVMATVCADGFVSENLATTVSYADIYRVVEDAMSLEWLLLESAAKHIADAVLDNWNVMKEVRVRITKTSAPISGIQGVCSVEYVSDR